MTARHAADGTHSFRDEAKVRAASYWDNEPGAVRPLRSRAERRRSQARVVLWATDRYVPLGVVGGQS